MFNNKEKERTSSVDDHFLYSHDLNVSFRGDIVRRDQMLHVVTFRGKVKVPHRNVRANKIAMDLL